MRQTCDENTTFYYYIFVKTTSLTFSMQAWPSLITFVIVNNCSFKPDCLPCSIARSSLSSPGPAIEKLEGNGSAGCNRAEIAERARKLWYNATCLIDPGRLLNSDNSLFFCCFHLLVQGETSGLRLDSVDFYLRFTHCW